jgi:inorganic pyrophosphatase
MGSHIPTITKQKWVRDIDQVEEHLFGKHDALSSNYSTAKKELFMYK